MCLRLVSTSVDVHANCQGYAADHAKSDTHCDADSHANGDIYRDPYGDTDTGPDFPSSGP